MVGLGETDAEIIETMKDIKQTGVSILTLGQYLQPSKKNLPVQRYVHPDRFNWFKEQGLKMGFDYIASGPLVRSSYLAAEHYLQLRLSRTQQT
jgi:lipoic acid synthetase